MSGDNSSEPLWMPMSGRSLDEIVAAGRTGDTYADQWMFYDYLRSQPEFIASGGDERDLPYYDNLREYRPEFKTIEDHNGDYSKYINDLYSAMDIGGFTRRPTSPDGYDLSQEDLEKYAKLEAEWQKNQQTGGFGGLAGGLFGTVAGPVVGGVVGALAGAMDGGRGDSTDLWQGIGEGAITGISSGLLPGASSMGEAAAIGGLGGAGASAAGGADSDTILQSGLTGAAGAASAYGAGDFMSGQPDGLNLSVDEFDPMSYDDLTGFDGFSLGTESDIFGTADGLSLTDAGILDNNFSLGTTSDVFDFAAEGGTLNEVINDGGGFTLLDEEVLSGEYEPEEPDMEGPGFEGGGGVTKPTLKAPSPQSARAFQLFQQSPFEFSPFERQIRFISPNLMRQEYIR